LKPAATDQLRDAAAESVRVLGQGLLTHPANTRLRNRISSGTLDALRFYRQLVRISLRLRITALAENSSLLFAPTATRAQREHYSQTKSLTALSSIAGDQSQAECWSKWLSTCHQLASETSAAREGLIAPGGGFFDLHSVPDIIAAADDDSTALDDATFQSIVREVLESTARPRTEAIRSLGTIYETLLELTPEFEHKSSLTFTLHHGSSNSRKKSGAYYTPDSLVQYLLDQTIEPEVLERTAASPADPASEILSITVCDPACGSGHFLLGAAQRLAAHLHSCDPARYTPDASLERVIRSCIFGVDRDPDAADLCRCALWLLAAMPTTTPRDLASNIRCGDALLGTSWPLIKHGIPESAFTARGRPHPKLFRRALYRNRAEEAELLLFPIPPAADLITLRRACDAWCAAFIIDPSPDLPTASTLADLLTNVAIDPELKRSIEAAALKHKFFHWPIEFPQIFTLPHQGFRIIIGNPPFLNQLETATATARGLEAIMRILSGGAIRGYTDISATFLLRSLSLVANRGRIGLVQPQSLLAAADAAPVRAELLTECSLQSLWVSNEYMFKGASVFTCAPVLQRGGPRNNHIRIATGKSFTPASVDSPSDTDALALQETWAHLAAGASGIPSVTISHAGTVADIATATADFRDQYYGLEGFLVEDSSLSQSEVSEADFPRLITSGLIDIAACRWGQAPTRVLKKVWDSPRIDRRRMEREGTLGAWLDDRVVPKLLLATQTRVLELIVDERGRMAPSTPLITIIPHDIERIWHLAAAISSPVCSAIALRTYAGAALATDAIKLSARQVLRLPIPNPSPEWDAAANLFRLAHAAASDSSRIALLGEFALHANAAYGVQSPTLCSWWTSRLEPKKRGRRG
jgi:hypothetical protein